MATPIFNAEIVKLRRRLGDVFTTAGTPGTLITTENVGTVDGDVWTRQELADVYNDAVRAFVDYIRSMLPKETWYVYLPGYIIPNDDQDVPGTARIDLDSLNPPGLQVLDIRDNNSDTIFVPKNPAEFLSYESSQFNVNDAFYMVAGNTIFLSKLTNSVFLIYLKKHQTVNYGDENDLEGISDGGLRRIMVIAEIFARAHKSMDVSDIPELRLQQDRETDVKEIMRDVR